MSSGEIAIVMLAWAAVAAAIGAASYFGLDYIDRGGRIKELAKALAGPKRAEEYKLISNCGDDLEFTGTLLGGYEYFLIGLGRGQSMTVSVQVYLTEGNNYVCRKTRKGKRSGELTVFHYWDHVVAYLGKGEAEKEFYASIGKPLVQKVA